MNLRQARSDRLSAAQRRFPVGHYIVLATFAALVLLTFLLLSAGTADFETIPAQAAQPGKLLWLQAPLFGLLCSAMALTALVLRDLANPGDATRQRIFGVKAVSQAALQGLSDELQSRSNGRPSSFNPCNPVPRI